MKLRLNRANGRESTQDSDSRFDWQALLNPASAFAHPRDVVADTDLTLNEKRAILASWASDACAVESAPALRRAFEAREPVTFDDVMDALRALDEKAAEYGKPVPHYRRVIAERAFGFFGRKRSGRHGDEGPQTSA